MLDNYKQNHHQIVACLLLFFFLIGGLQAAGIKKWTDEDGKVHYGDRPPSSASVSEVNQDVSVFASASKPNNTILYSTKNCGYCKKAKAFMASNSIPYKEYDIEDSISAKRRYTQLGGRGVPLLELKGKTIQGFSEARYQRFFANYK